MPSPRAVASDGVTLACRDFGGDGPDLVLLHGAGMTQRSLEAVAGLLGDACRVVTYDLRGHGDSTDGQWTFEAALRDLDAVIAAFDLSAPAVAGHSLGGMLALLYGATHPECPGVVNLDGWGLGRPEEHDGIAVSEVEAFHALVRAGRGFTPLGTAVIWMARHLPRARAHATSQAQAQDAALGLDVLAAHRAVRCPVLTVNARGRSPRVNALLVSRAFTQVGQAHREGLRRELAVLARSHPNVTVLDLPDAHHGLIRTHPDLVAVAIRDFLALSAPARPTG